MRRTLVLSAVVLTGLMAQAAGLIAQKTKDTFYPATVTFASSDASGVFDDGGGPYVDGGTAKLETGFHSVTGDLVMRARTGPSPRYLHFVPLARPGSPAVAPFNEHDIFMNIRNILGMGDGASKLTIAVFRTSRGNFRFDPTYGRDGQQATLVTVSRSGQSTWDVTATVSDVAALETTVKNKITVQGLYTMPFTIAVACGTCPGP